MGQTVTDIEYDVKLRMCISAISALRFLQQSNCPPMFTSTNVPCLHIKHFVRQTPFVTFSYFTHHCVHPIE